MTATLKIAVADHPIKSVTVFKFKAEVVRTFKIELQAGQTKVEITGLPSIIQRDSIRVSGLGQARLFDVVCTIESNTTGVNEDSPSEVIRLLRKKKLELQSQKGMLETQAEILVLYAKTLNGEHISPSDMSQFLDSFSDHSRKSLAALSAANEEIVLVDRQITQEIVKSNAKKGSSNGKVSVVIGTEEAGSVELKLTYIVDDASWSPTYELHARTDNGKPVSGVSLHYRARVNQSTGEDWSDTALTLSTVASDKDTGTIPLLKPVKIRPQVGKGFVNFQTFQQQQQHQQQVQQEQLQLQQMQQQQARTKNGGLFAQAHPQAQFVPQPSLFSQTVAQPTQWVSGANQSQQASIFGSVTNNVGPGFGGGGFGAFGSTGFGTSSTPPPLRHVPNDSAHHGESEVEIHPVEEEESFETIEEPSAILEPTTVVSETPLAISYAVEGKSTIPSDGVQHQVCIAVLPFESKVTHVTVPRVQPNVYLQCEVKNTSEYRLLPGPVTVILDDSFVSKTSIPDINTGDRFNCTLGVDSSTKVSYTRSSRTVRSPAGTFAEVYNTTTYTSNITIHNKHAFPISELIVRDVLPMSEDKRIKVILRKPAGLADAKDGQVLEVNKDGLKVQWERLVDGKGGEKEGRFEWLWKVGAGGQIKLEAEWEVKTPADIRWGEPHFG